MRKIFYNFLYQSSYQLAQILLPIITIPIVSRALGPEGIGTWNYIQSIMNYFVLLAGLGLANYGVREIAIVRKDKGLLSQKFWELEGFNILFSFIALCLYLIISLFLDNAELYLIQSLVLIGALFDISWFFSGIEDFKKITLTGIAIKFISLLLIILLIKEKDDLIWYVLIQSITILLNQIVLWVFVLHKVSFVRVNINQILAHFIPATRFFISKIAMTIYLNLNKTILGILTTMTVVGYYSNALTLVTLSGSIITALNTVLIPAMSNIYLNGNEDKLISSLKKSIHLQLFITIPISFGIILVNGKMISWFFGEEFLFLKNIVPLLAPVVIVQSLQSGIAAQYLIPKNDMKSYNLTVILGAIVSLVCNIIFIPILGIYGAIISTIAGQSTLCFIRSFVLVKQTKFRFDLMLIVKFFISAFIMLVVGKFLTKNFSETPITTLLQVIIGFGIYFVASTMLKANPIIDFIRSGKKNYN